MKIIVKNELLNGLTQADFIKQAALDNWKKPMFFDLATMFNGKHSEIEKVSINHVIGSIVSFNPEEGFDLDKVTGYDVYCLMLIASDLELDIKEWEMTTSNAYDNLELEDIIANIDSRVIELAAFARQCFEITKSAIVSKALCDKLDTDMNQLSFNELFNYGSNIEKTFISDNGGIIVEYNSFDQFESDDGFSFNISEDGTPYIPKPEVIYQTENAGSITINSFSESR